MPDDAKFPITVTCEWCGDRLLSTRGSAYYDAIDHALDRHRLKLLADPDDAGRAFTVSQPGAGGTGRRRLRPERTHPHGWIWK